MNEYVSDEGEIDGAKVLDIPMLHNDADATTIRSYLIALLCELWSSGEGFSGKRPFGNSGWEYDLYKPLIKAGAITGELDEEDGLISVETSEGNEMIFAAIEALS